MENLNDSDDDICWDESGFSCGAGAPKIKQAPQPVPGSSQMLLDVDGVKVTLSRHDVQAVDAEAGAD